MKQNSSPMSLLAKAKLPASPHAWEWMSLRAVTRDQYFTVTNVCDSSGLTCQIQPLNSVLSLGYPKHNHAIGMRNPLVSSQD